jgi:hypothetical protein
MIKEIHVPAWRALEIYADKFAAKTDAAKAINESLPTTGKIRYQADDIYRHLSIQLVGFVVLLALMPIMIVDIFTKFKIYSALCQFVEIKKKVYITYEEIHEKLKTDVFWYVVEFERWSRWYDIEELEMQIEKLRGLNKNDVVVIKN